MTDYDTWRIIKASALHFKSTSYDAFKFNFKGGRAIQRKHFDELPQNQRYILHKLAKKLKNDKMVQTFAYANIVHANTSWFCSMTFTPFIEYLKFIQNFSYLFKKELSHINIPFNEYLTTQNGEHSPIIIDFMRNKCRIELVLIIDALTGFLEHTNRTVFDTLLWPDTYMLLQKSKPFVFRDINLSAAKKILFKHFFDLQQTQNSV